MAWNGTVTCSECWREGHNRNGCPRRKERYQEALAMSEEERGYGERRIIEDFEAKKKTNASRKCSYCGLSGHNRRKCSVLIVHTTYIQKQEVAFRTAFIEHLNEVGLNVGALINPETCDSNNYRGHEGVHLVTSIDLSAVSITTCNGALQRFIFAKPISALGDPRSLNQFSMVAPEHWNTGPKWTPKDNRWQEISYGAKVVSPSSSPLDLDSSWVEDGTAVKNFFKDRSSWMWTEEEGNDGGYYSVEWWALEEEQELSKSA